MRVVKFLVSLGRGSVVTSALLCPLLLATARSALAEEPTDPDRAAAVWLATTTCGTCHGPQGNSTQPKFPRLAGQNANYLAAQLRAFRAQSRGDPDAIGYMWGMASQLDDATVTALAAYYASQHVETGTRDRGGAPSRGQEIYQQGIPGEGVPACSACHGPDAHGLQDFPRLAGQHAQYILKQLASFQSNMRNVAVMHGVAQNLRTAEMQAVAEYLEPQP